MTGRTVHVLCGALGIPVGLTGSADQVRTAVGGAGRDLPSPPVVSFLTLGFALVLSIWKPWGRTRWGGTRWAARPTPARQ